MRVLLDTCTFLWIASDPSKLSSDAANVFRDAANTIWLSAVSVWEIAAKHSMGRLQFPESPQTYVPKLRARHGIEALPLDEESALHLERLPDHHRDPFDRMLVCQALVHGLSIMTPDGDILRYPARTIW